MFICIHWLIGELAIKRDPYIVVCKSVNDHKSIGNRGKKTEWRNLLNGIRVKIRRLQHIRTLLICCHQNTKGSFPNTPWIGRFYLPRGHAFCPHRTYAIVHARRVYIYYFKRIYAPRGGKRLHLKNRNNDLPAPHPKNV